MNAWRLSPIVLPAFLLLLAGCAGTNRGWSVLDSRTGAEPSSGAYFRTTFSTPYPIRGIEAGDGGLILLHPGSRSYDRVLFDADHIRFLSSTRLDGPSPLGPVAATGDGGFWYVAADRGSIHHVPDRGKFSQLLISAADTLSRPRITALAWDRNTRRLWAADTANHCVYVWDPEVDARPIRTLGHRGTGTGEFNFPTGIAMEPGGSLLVLDTLNGRVQRRHTDDTFEVVLTLESSSMERPTALASDGEGQIWIYDNYGAVVRGFHYDGSPLVGERNEALALAAPAGCASLVADHRGRLWLADPLGATLTVFTTLPPAGKPSP